MIRIAGGFRMYLGCVVTKEVDEVSDGPDPNWLDWLGSDHANRLKSIEEGSKFPCK